MRIVKASPGLDPENILARELGADFTVVEFDETKPLIEQVAGAHVLLLRDVAIPAELIDAAPALKLLQRYGQHLVGVDVAHARRKGIWVARAPVILTEADRVVAEHAMFLMLALVKRYREGLLSIERGLLGRPVTRSLLGKTLGLVGVGKTGAELARLARGFGMSVIAVKRTPDPRLEEELGLAFLGTMDQLDELLGRADFVSIHLPLEAETAGFFGRREFEGMKPGGYLINIARGPIIDQDALLAALRSGHLAGAGLDVFAQEPINPADPILQLATVIATPHIAGATEEMQKRLAEIVAENIRLVSAGSAPRHQVA
jgi:phosphoglycerate dehydrogenase-like enzyme